MTSEIICQINMTQEQYDEICKCESVVIREFERTDGSRFGEAIAWGEADEMRDVADTPAILVLPVGVSVVCQTAVPVSKLFAEQPA